MYRPTIDEALEELEKLQNIIDMADYTGAIMEDEVSTCLTAFAVIKMYIQNSVPRAE